MTRDDFDEDLGEGSGKRAPGGTSDAGGAEPAAVTPAGEQGAREPRPGDTSPGRTAPPDRDLLPGGEEPQEGIPGPVPVREQGGL